MSDNLQTKEPIFICGLGRSGTGWLSKSLGQSQDNLAWLAKVGSCHGLFSKVYREEKVNNDYELVKEHL